MEYKIIQEPKYQLTLTSDEIRELWDVMYYAVEKNIKGSAYFYSILEDIRPAGGFKEGK